MPLFGQAVQANAPAVQLYPFGAVAGAARRVSVYNNGPLGIYLGPVGVTSNTGFRITPGGSFTFSEKTINGPIYVACDTLQVTPNDTRVLVEVGD